MSSSMRGSEEAMASIAFDEVGETIEAPRILVGGLGMGFTLRAVLDAFDASATVCVAELLPVVIRYNRGILAELADHPLEDPRVDVHEGDVREAIRQGPWDIILLDVDNGPDALTAESNQALYSARGVQRIAREVAPGGVLIVWSAFPSPRFVERLRKTGLDARAEKVRARWPESKGPMHTLFIANRPQ